jgi:hypothetical protein
MKCSCPEEGVLKEGSIKFKSKIKEELVEIRNAKGGWSTLYKCRDCGTYWEEYYPHSEYHGGGPAELRKVDSEYVKEKYGIN